MADKNRLKELVRSLDCQNLDPTTMAELENMISDMNTADGGNGAVGKYDKRQSHRPGIAEEIGNKLPRLKSPGTAALKRQSIKDDILGLLEVVECHER